MRQTKVSRRYAKSLLDLAQEKGLMDAIYHDMVAIHKLCNTNKDFTLMLRNPLVNADRKKNILQAIFSGKLNNLTNMFLELLTSKKREMYLEAIAVDFIDEYKIIKGITTAMITAAHGLDDNMRKQVIELVRNSGTNEVELTEKINPELIGGFVLRIGNIQYDTTVAKNLNELKMNFTKNLYVAKIKNK